jgi:hypothetical protein
VIALQPHLQRSPELGALCDTIGNDWPSLCHGVTPSSDCSSERVTAHRFTIESIQKDLAPKPKKRKRGSREKE